MIETYLDHKQLPHTFLIENLNNQRKGERIQGLISRCDHLEMIEKYFTKKKEELLFQ